MNITRIRTTLPQGKPKAPPGIVGYKGRKYHLLWSGPTKYGHRAKLRFINADTEFWVNSDKLETVPKKVKKGSL